LKIEKNKLKSRSRYRNHSYRVGQLILLPVVLVLGALFFLYSISYADKNLGVKGSTNDETKSNDSGEISFIHPIAKEVRFHKTLPTSNGFVSVGTCYLNDEMKYQLLVVYFDASMIEQWRFEFGGTGDEWAYDVVEDEGFVVVGVSASKEYGVRGRYDALVLKLDYSGKLSWFRVFGGPDWDRAYKIAKIPNGYAFAGDNYLKGFDVSSNFGEHDFWVVAIDKKGRKIWDRSFGGLKWDRAYALAFVGERNLLVIGGSSNSFTDGNRYDSYVVAYDLNGNLVWRLPLVIQNASVWLTDLRTSGVYIYAAGYVSEFVQATNGGALRVTTFERAFLAKISFSGKMEYFKVFGQNVRLHAFELIESAENHETFVVAGYKDLPNLKSPWFATITVSLQQKTSQNIVIAEMEEEKYYGEYFDVQFIPDSQRLLLSGTRLVNGRFLGILNSRAISE